ncbi:MAG: DUF2911 domain-containing protein [Acidobacteria bacterium]|nr:DUF2911 domain-containing protein [Acidobacteriota bacterium]
MKQSVTLVVFLSAVLLLFGHDNEKRAAAVVVKGKKVSIEYFSPHLKGRDLLSLIQPGMEWRMGADAPTTLTTEADLSFGNAAIPKGFYSLVAKNIGPDQWTLIFSSDSQIRGTRRDTQKDVASVPLTLSKLQETVEHMNIELKPSGENSAQFSLVWGNTSLATSFKVSG